MHTQRALQRVRGQPWHQMHCLPCSTDCTSHSSNADGIRIFGLQHLKCHVLWTYRTLLRGAVLFFVWLHCTEAKSPSCQVLHDTCRLGSFTTCSRNNRVCTFFVHLQHRVDIFLDSSHWTKRHWVLSSPFLDWIIKKGISVFSPSTAAPEQSTSEFPLLNPQQLTPRILPGTTKRSSGQAQSIAPGSGNNTEEKCTINNCGEELNAQRFCRPNDLYCYTEFSHCLESVVLSPFSAAPGETWGWDARCHILKDQTLTKTFQSDTKHQNFNTKGKNKSAKEVHLAFHTKSQAGPELPAGRGAPGCCLLWRCPWQPPLHGI